MAADPAASRLLFELREKAAVACDKAVAGAAAALADKLAEERRSFALYGQRQPPARLGAKPRGSGEAEVTLVHPQRPPAGNEVVTLDDLMNQSGPAELELERHRGWLEAWVANKVREEMQ